KACPIEESANGRVYFDIPFEFQGQTFQGITLFFEDGKATKLTLDRRKNPVDYDAKLNFLNARMIKGKDSDLYIPNFDRLGGFSIGLNPRISNLMGSLTHGKPNLNGLIAEKQGVQFVLGSSYPDLDGVND